MLSKRRDQEPVSAAVESERRRTPTREPGATNPTPSVIGATLSIQGTLTGNEDVLVEGRFGGEIKLPENVVVVGGSGDVNANINAKVVTIHGRTDGDVQAMEQVEISATGSMRGDILSPRVILHNGAKFKGRIDMEPDGIAEAAKPFLGARTSKPPSKSAKAPDRADEGLETGGAAPDTRAGG